MRLMPAVAAAVGLVPRDVLFNPFKNRLYVASSDTIQSVINAAVAGDVIFVEPGEYAEVVTIARAKSNLTLIGLGGRGAVAIQATANGVALTNEADDVTLINLGLEGDGTGGGLVNRGRRLRTYGCKIEGGAVAVKMTLGTDAQITAETHGDGSDCMLVDTEICWATKGLEIVATDYGAVTQLRVIGGRFHDNSAADIEESGGSVDIRFRDLEIAGVSFLRQEDGTEPTKYISLNDDNGNKGVVHGCSFPTAINGGKNLVSTGLIWVGNYHTGGISAAQPS